MAFDKATILELLEGIDPNTRSRIVNSLVEGTSPEERERIIDKTDTKKLFWEDDAPYTSDQHTELMEMALGEDEDLANALATWIKKPANEEWLGMVLGEETMDPESVVGGAQLAGDRGFFRTMEENPLGMEGIAKGIMDLLRKAGINLYDLDKMLGVAPPASELQTPAEMGQGIMGGLGALDESVLGGPGGAPPGLAGQAMGGLRGMLGQSPPGEIMPEDLQGIM